MPPVQSLAVIPSGPARKNVPTVMILSAVLAAALAALSGLVRRGRQLRGTTLLAPCGWTLAALAMLVLSQLIAAGQVAEANWVQHVRYLAGCATFCPLMAVLGAKRPQDRAWQFVVLSLYIVLALPALQQWLARPFANFELHSAWQWFVCILIAVGLFNSLPTRYWPSALLAAAGQGSLLWPWLPLQDFRSQLTEPAELASLGAMFWCLSVALWAWDLPRRRSTPSPADRVWLDFRDLLGAMWSLRVMERINAAGTQLNWPLRLRWGGWTGKPHAADETIEMPPAMLRSWRMLLRRFVSPEWIDRRLSPPVGP